MATYDKLIYDIPPYQEGNENDFEFDLDENFSIDQVSDITFQVRSMKGDELISKRKSSGSITVSGRTVIIPISPEETIGKAGSYLYEIDFVNLHGNPFVTMGGSFTINKEINTL